MVPDQFEAGAIGLIWNYDAPSGGNNPDDEITFRVGIDSTPLSGDISRDTTSYDVPTELIGTEITLAAELSFVSTNIVLNGSLTDDQGNVTTASSTVAAVDYTGDYFGFATRGRARTYVTDPTGARGNPQVFDFTSFTLTVIPEPSTFNLVAMMGGTLLLLRRRLKLN